MMKRLTNRVRAALRWLRCAVFGHDNYSWRTGYDREREQSYNEYTCFRCGCSERIFRADHPQSWDTR